jgi:hypothetical protein
MVIQPPGVGPPAQGTPFEPRHTKENSVVAEGEDLGSNLLHAARSSPWDPGGVRFLKLGQRRPEHPDRPVHGCANSRLPPERLLFCLRRKNQGLIVDILVRKLMDARRHMELFERRHGRSSQLNRLGMRP